MPTLLSSDCLQGLVHSLSTHLQLVRKAASLIDDLDRADLISWRVLNASICFTATAPGLLILRSIVKWTAGTRELSETVVC